MSTYLSASKATVLTTQATIYYYTDEQSSGGSEWSYDNWYDNGSSYVIQTQREVLNSNPMMYYTLLIQPKYRTARKNSIHWSLPNGNTSSDPSGNITITGLTPGTASTFTATVSTYTLYYQTGNEYSLYMYDENKNFIGMYDYSSHGDVYLYELNAYAPRITGYQTSWIYETSDLTISPSQPEGTSCSVTVYTRPGNFTDYNFIADTEVYSANGLTTGKVNNWIDHCNQFAHWWYQNDTDVAGANAATENGRKCQAVENTYITASWYNACVGAIPEGRRPATVEVNDLITVGVMKALGDAISADDNTSVS